jgi:hypothetical protein
VFEVIQKKGNESRPCGRVIGYVKIPKPEPGQDETPFDALVSPDGILAIQGDYSKTPDFDAFRNNLQQSLPRGLQDILKQILGDDEIRESLDLSKTKKISVSVFPKGGSNFGDFFPVPAQLVPCQSEELLLKEDADIYFLGEFRSVSNAHLFLMGFPILYQARYRELAEREREGEVDALLAEIGEKEAVAEIESLALCLEGDLSNYKGNLLDLLVTQVLPKIMYSIERDGSEYLDANIGILSRFMRTYPHQQDVEKMVSILQKIKENKHPTPDNTKGLAL